MSTDLSSIVVADRRKAREITLQVLFQREFVRDVETQTSLEYFREIVTATPEAWRYTEFLLSGVNEHLSAIDEAISTTSKNWKIARISPVDLSILRVGTFEILFASREVPPKAVINEAIEVARRYGSTESSAFINGILNAIMEGHAAT